MAKKEIVTVNEAVAFELPEGETVTHAAEFIEEKKVEIKIGDKFVHLLGLNRQVHQVVDIFGGSGAPSGALYFLTPATLRPRVGDQLFITVTEKMLTTLFRPFKPGRPIQPSPNAPSTEAEPATPNTDEDSV